MAEGAFEKFGQHREDVDLHEANLTRRGQSGDGSRESGVGSRESGVGSRQSKNETKLRLRL